MKARNPHRGMSARKTRKFMQVLDGPPWSFLKKEARKRGMSPQAFLRAVVIPEWFRDQSQLPLFATNFALGLAQAVGQALGTRLITSVLKGKSRAKSRIQSHSDPARRTRNHAGSPLAPSRGKPS